MRDRLNKVIYVGKARDLRKRLSNYFQPSRQTLAEAKTRALIHSIWDFEIHLVRNEPEALLLEGKLIKEFRPRYNIAFRDDKRFLLLKIHLEDPYPRFQTTRLKKPDGARYFGPFASSGALRATLDWINKEYGLRVCRPKTPGERDYKHCNADVIRNCAAPCIGRVNRDTYRERIASACSFLERGDRAILKSVKAEMEEAASQLDFERAAQLRDVLTNLEKTLRPTRQFRSTNTQRMGEAIQPESDIEELGEYLRLSGPPKLIECFDISNISTTYSVASMVRFRDGKPDNAAYRRYKIKTLENAQNDFASMAEVIRRRYSRILLEARQAARDQATETTESPREATQRLIHQAEKAESEGRASQRKKPLVRLPDLIVVDGGKGQLSSALEELRRLGLHDQPIVGLAKQREEIFFPGESTPLRIPHDRGSLKLLQRLRDEAHRTANGYHQLLMKRRVRESLLDDVPGISQAKKKILLEKFGSVTRLQNASAEEIAQIKGISRAGAEKILASLLEISAI